jgi:hypothetical protein
MAELFQGLTPQQMVQQARSCVLVGAASATAFDTTRAVLCITAGAYTIQFVDDASAVALTLSAGVVYPFQIKAMTSGATGGLGLLR